MKSSQPESVSNGNETGSPDSFYTDESDQSVNLSNQFAGVLTSMLVHCVLLILLTVVVLPQSKLATDSIRLDAGYAEADNSVDLVSLEMADSSQDEPLFTLDEAPLADTELLSHELQSMTEVPVEISDLLDQREPDNPLQSESSEAVADMSDLKTPTAKSKATKRPKSAIELMATVSRKGKSFSGPLLKDPKDGVRQTRSTDEATQGVLDHLRQASDHNGQVWILWVMDASISLVEERQQLAPIVKGFYDELKAAKKPGAFPWPTTAVFAFGQGVMPLGVNTGQPKPLEIANTLINVPIDDSGTENVMTAVASAVASIPIKNRNTRIEVVVWTDESGDDLHGLEDVILLCRQRNTRVHVVGPLSVLGMRKGLQQFTLPPPYDQPILLPVDRGPDSAFPERAQLPYWYESSDIDWGNGPIIPANLGARNFGGPHRQRLLAPSGPYALTRLALATGGSFTAINRPGDIAAATREQLFDYMPDYRSALEIAYDIDRYPLRRAVIEAAALTANSQYWPPRMNYPTGLNTQFPFRSVGLYQTPQTFARQLPDELQVSVQRLRSAQVAIEQAIQIMMLRFNYESYADTESNSGQTGIMLNEVSLEQVTPSEYHQEQSPRWKAWYDLNLGRLLAHSVRIHEYMLQCEVLASPQSRTLMLNQGFNQLTLAPSTEMRGGPISVTRVRTATKLLERVVRDHADTPWGDLATWELEHPVGVKSILSIRLPPRPVVGIPLPPQPRPALPRL
jgi:hypothetical protein